MLIGKFRVKHMQCSGCGRASRESDLWQGPHDAAFVCAACHRTVLAFDLVPEHEAPHYTTIAEISHGK
jgi:hypothetical protein